MLAHADGRTTLQDQRDRTVRISLRSAGDVLSRASRPQTGAARLVCVALATTIAGMRKSCIRVCEAASFEQGPLYNPAGFLVGNRALLAAAQAVARRRAPDIRQMLKRCSRQGSGGCGARRPCRAEEVRAESSRDSPTMSPLPARPRIT